MTPYLHISIFVQSGASAGQVRLTAIMIQGDSGGVRLGWVDLDLGCSTILLGQ